MSKTVIDYYNKLNGFTDEELKDAIHQTETMLQAIDEIGIDKLHVFLEGLKFFEFARNLK